MDLDKQMVEVFLIRDRLAADFANAIITLDGFPQDFDANELLVMANDPARMERAPGIWEFLKGGGD